MREGSSVTRRDFLKTATAAVTFAAVSPALKAASLGADATAGGRSLVILQMIGANDTLNTFIPYTDPRYRAARPTLGIPDAKILPVDSTIGFHPSLPGLKDLYLQRKLAIVPQVGFSSLDRSHFRCEDVWMTASEDPDTEPRGWIGRWADLYASSPVEDLGVTPYTPRGLVAARALPACLTDLESFNVAGIPGDAAESALFESSLRANYGVARGTELLEFIRESGTKAFIAVDTLSRVPKGSAGYPATNLGRALSLAAKTIRQNVGTHIIWITLGGFDTHANQIRPPGQGGSLAGIHADLLSDLSLSLLAFQSDIENLGIADRTLVLAWSEFGRRVAENASLGTDHGKGGSLMLLGSRVAGGQLYGDPYDLADLDEGDLQVRIDFRRVYATIIRKWIGGDPDVVLGKRFEPLDLIESAPSRRRAS